LFVAVCNNVKCTRIAALRSLTCCRADRLRAAALVRFILHGLCGLLVAAVALTQVFAQSGFDRPGGDYARFTIPSGDPAVCAARCDRDNRCRAWTFSYPGTAALGGSERATCWLKSKVTPL